MAPHLSETTVAAPRTPILRASVNAERGGDQRIAKCALQPAAKIGNATPKQRTAKDSPGGWADNAARAQIAHDIAHRGQAPTP